MKKRRKYTVKTKGRMFVIILFFGAIIATLGYTFFLDLGRIHEMKKEEKSLNQEKSKLLDVEETIQADIKRLSDPEYIARYVREKYMYSKDGELILRIEE